jgi:hypothetical protein
VVGWRDRAILLPGRSFSGKTTLVAALVGAGATYYSDEYAVLDAKGRVHPYARPLSIRSADDARSRRCPVEELGGVSATRPLPVGLIAVTQFRPGTRRPGPWRALSPGQAVLALLSHTVPARRKPATALATLRQAVAPATALRGARGEADRTAEALLASLERCP